MATERIPRDELERIAQRVRRQVSAAQNSIEWLVRHGYGLKDAFALKSQQMPSELEDESISVLTEGLIRQGYTLDKALYLALGAVTKHGTTGIEGVPYLTSSEQVELLTSSWPVEVKTGQVVAESDKWKQLWGSMPTWAWFGIVIGIYLLVKKDD